MISGLIHDKMTDAVIEYDDLGDLPTPEAHGTHYPVPHKSVVDIVKTELTRLGIPVSDEKYIVTGAKTYMKGKAEVDPNLQYDRMFGLIELDTTVFGVNDWYPTIGVRNSHDRSTSMSVVGGSHTMVCSNLQIIGEHVANRRHTRNVYMDLHPMIAALIQNVVGTIKPYNEQRDFWRRLPVTIEQGDVQIIEAARQGVIPPSKVLEVSNEWHEPNFNYGNKQRCLHDFSESFTASAMRPTTTAGLNSGISKMIDLTNFVNLRAFDIATA